MLKPVARRMVLAGSALAVTAVLATGCSSHSSGSSASRPASTITSSPAAAQTPAASTGTSASGPTTPSPAASHAAAGQPVSSATTQAASTDRVPMPTAAGGEFLSPSGDISCEVSTAKVYCQTGTPARSVTMDATGHYTTCTGQQCLGNPGEGTPTLAYGKVTGVGPFTCASTTVGVTCATGGRGFRINTLGISPVPA